MSLSKLTVELWPVSLPGQSDELNEDAVLVFQPADPQKKRIDGSLYIIADGQGGAQRGRLASSYAAQRVMASYYASDEPDLGLRLQMAIDQANRELFEHAKQRPELVKLTTSLVAAVVRGEQLHVASVGSARAYLLRDGGIDQINHDHTLVQRLIDEGAISPDEARSHPRRETVLRTIGSAEEIEVDIFDLRLDPDDVILLCTDGLTRHLSDQEINEIAATQQPRKAAEALAMKASDRGSKDDVTLVAALIRDGAPPFVTDIPFSWDGSEPTFEKDPTLTVQRPTIPVASPPVEAAPDEIETTESAITDDGWLASGELEGATRPVESVAAPSFETQEQPAPDFQSMDSVVSEKPSRESVAVTRQVGPTMPRGYQPPAGYEFDPVTGLSPTPSEKVIRPDRSRQSYQQAQKRRGISLGAFLAIAVVTVLIVVSMVFLLVNPFNWDLKVANLLGGREEPTPTLTPTLEPTTAVVVTTPDPLTEPTATLAPVIETPAGMVLVEEGTFTRGAAQNELDQAALECIRENAEANRCYPEYFSDAQPVAEITLTGYFISQTEVTNAAYQACVEAGTCTEPADDTYYADANYTDHPVVFVNFEQATAYCNWIGGRLPTEAEWEKAARFDPPSGESFWFPWGNQYAPGRANTLAAGLNGTSPVSSFPQDISPLGISGLAGNVSEWVFDWYFTNYEGLGTLNPTGPDTQPLTEPFRVGRGGSFLSLEPFARGAQRLDVPPATAAEWLGFRCVIDLPTTTG